MKRESYEKIVDRLTAEKYALQHRAEQAEAQVKRFAEEVTLAHRANDATQGELRGAKQRIATLEGYVERVRDADYAAELGRLEARRRERAELHRQAREGAHDFRVGVQVEPAE